MVANRKAKKLFVTGGNGFVGGWLRFLLESGQLPLDMIWVTAEPACDIRDAAALRAQIRQSKPDWVIHLAAQSSVAYAMTNPEETIDINIKGTLNLLQALKAENFKGRLLYVSSSDAYGVVPEKDLPILETKRLEPRNSYAVSKAACEYLCQQWIFTEGMDIVIARPFNHIGPGQSPQFSVASFAKQIAEISLNMRPPNVIAGNVEITRDFTDVRDVVLAYVSLLYYGETGEVYNVCSGHERKIIDLIEMLIGIANIKVEILSDYNRIRFGEQIRTVGNNSKISESTGWVPIVSINTTLDDILTYWKRILLT